MLDGAKVYDRRMALGLLQGQLADLVSIRACTVCKIEGKGKRISLALAIRLAWALRCPLSDLV